jgi:hypothetical protein
MAGEAQTMQYCAAAYAAILRLTASTLHDDGRGGARINDRRSCLFRPLPAVQSSMVMIPATTAPVHGRKSTVNVLHTIHVQLVASTVLLRLMVCVTKCMHRTMPTPRKQAKDYRRYNSPVS